MPSIKDLEDRFAVEFEQDVLQSVPDDHRVSGVSLLPLHTYKGKDAKLNGRICMVLGKERDGAYTGMLNFIGGKVGLRKDKSLARHIARELFREVYEELHIALDAASLRRCLLGCAPQVVPYREKHVALLFVAHITGLSRIRWDKEHSERKLWDVSWHYVEMSSIRHVPLVDPDSSYVLSAYVRNALAAVKQLHDSRIADAPAVSCLTLPLVQVRLDDAIHVVGPG